MTKAPDYCRPVTGWRLWSVAADDGRARLMSPVCPSVWQPGHELVAACDVRRREFVRPWRQRHMEHAAPGARCSCGVHAMARPGYLATYVPPAVSRRRVLRVVGRVALWGEVVEGTRGWRAARGYPAELWVPQVDAHGTEITDVESIAIDLADYGVPVHVCDGLTPREAIAELGALRHRAVMKPVR